MPYQVLPVNKRPKIPQILQSVKRQGNRIIFFLLDCCRVPKIDNNRGKAPFRIPFAASGKLFPPDGDIVKSPDKANHPLRTFAGSSDGTNSLDGNSSEVPTDFISSEFSRSSPKARSTSSVVLSISSVALSVPVILRNIRL
jgi:hypothetical protein